MTTHRHSIFAVATCLFLVTTAACSAQNEQGIEELKQPIIEMRDVKIKVIDPDGHPVEEVKVIPYGLWVTPKDRLWLWRKKIHGPVPQLMTDSEGLAILSYPLYAVEKLETNQVSLNVKHPDFIISGALVNVADAPAIIQLKRGFRIAATAIDAATGEKIKTDLYGLISGRQTRLKDWKLTQNGMLVSPVFAQQKSWLRLIKITPGEPLLFSDLIEIDPKEDSRVLLRDVKLFPGVRVEGKLAPSAKRPVLNGFVVAYILRYGDKSSNDFSTTNWEWRDKALVAEDGTFVFESLPRDEILQMIPFYDDAAPANSSDKEIDLLFPGEGKLVGFHDSAISAHAIRLDKPKVRAILNMNPSTSVRITVVDQNGKPLPDVVVQARLYQHWFTGIPRLIHIESGGINQMCDQLVASRHGGSIPSQPLFYSGKTDEQGVALIKNMPPGTIQEFSAELDGFEIPVDENDLERKLKVDLKQDSLVEVTIRMQPAGTQILDDKGFRDQEEGVDDETGKDDSEKSDGNVSKHVGKLNNGDPLK